MTKWRKSSFSGQAGNCVEVATTSDGALVRNSTRPEADTLTLDPSALAAFVAGCVAGEMDDLT